MPSRRIVLCAGLIAATAGLVSGCGSDASSTPAAEADSVTVSAPWVKAAPAGAMTAAFGELINDGDAPVRVVGAESSVAPRMELHEVVAGDGGTKTMRQKEGGFVVAAHSSHELAPGADHIMLLDIPAPLTPGTDVTVTLRFEDGSTTPFTAQVRDFPGAAENYQPDGQVPPAESTGG